jgi:hypothetical protein
MIYTLQHYRVDATVGWFSVYRIGLNRMIATFSQTVCNHGGSNVSAGRKEKIPELVLERVALGAVELPRGGSFWVFVCL